MSCKEKACIYPVADETTGLCRYHLRDSKEPRSLNPSTMVAFEKNPSGVIAGAWDAQKSTSSD